jgi:molecular chaperone DnaJ
MIRGRLFYLRLALQTKDYYKILELPPSATLKEIKTAYRRLAHQFHPDKNGNDLYAAAQFEIIKEAYEVLTNPSKKEYYLQQRWYAQSMGKKQTETIITPVTVLKQFLELDKYVSKLDVHRMDKEGLYAYIIHILSGETIDKLNAFNEKDINTSIVESVLKCSLPLPWSLAKPLSEKLLKLNSNVSAAQSIHKYTQYARSFDTLNKYKPWAVLLIVAALCLLIYIISS